MLLLLIFTKNFKKNKLTFSGENINPMAHGLWRMAYGIWERLTAFANAIMPNR